MSTKRKPLETSLFRPKEEIEQDTVVRTSVDMSSERKVKRASFDVFEDQIASLGQLKYRSGRKISELVQEALDDLLAKYP